MSDEEPREDQYREAYETAFELDDQYEVDEHGQFRLVLSDRWKDRD